MNIFVASLPFSTDDQDLRELFEPFGEVDSAKVIFDRDRNRSKGFGFVEMADDASAQTAISELNESSFEGRDLVVKVAEDRPQRSERY
jgi:RNA recognition motif-containing protein